MKILHKLCYIALVSVLTLPHLLLAATSQRISYQGRLANPQGKLLDGEFCMQFSIWDDPNPGSGTQLWPVGGEKDTYDGGAGNQTQITVTEGVFNVELGTDISLNSANWEAGTYWDSNGETTYLHVEIAQYRAGCQTYETLAPRQSITASGQTQNADKLDGHEWTEVSTVVAEGSSLQNAYSGGNTITLDITEGDLRIVNDEPTPIEMLFLDENTGRVGMGTTEPNEQLEITGNLRLPNTTATSGILYLGANSFLHNFAYAGSEGKNTFVGENTGNFTLGDPMDTWAGTYNTGIGYHVLSGLTTGSDNIAIGVNTMTGLTEGYNNIAIGNDTLDHLTTGTTNIAIGPYAAKNMREGTENIAIGSGALRDSNNFGSIAIGNGALLTSIVNNNLAIGNGALYCQRTGEGNTAIGREAGRNQYCINGSAAYNVLIGDHAGSFLQSGQSNVVIGYYSGETLDSGSGNIYLGYRAGDNNGGNYNIVIGYDIEIAGSNNMSIGNLLFANNLNATGQSISSGNIGIGINNPSNRLHIGVSDSGINTVLNSLRLQRETTGVAAAGLGTALDFYLEDASNYVNQAARLDVAWEVATNGSEESSFRFNTMDNGVLQEKMRIDDNGNVGVGITNPSGKLQVVGDEVRIGDSGSIGYAVADGDLYIERNLEADGTAYLGATTYFSGGTTYYIGSTGRGRFSNVWLDNGTVSAPAISFANKTDLGIYYQSESGKNFINFASLGKNIMRIDYRGNIGIGSDLTVQPETNLDIYENSSTYTRARVRNKSSAYGASSIFTLGNDAQDYGVEMILNSSGNGSLGGLNSFNILSNYNAPITISTQALERMRITDTGNVGIGTTAPNVKLEVNGGIRLNTTDAKPTCDANQRGTFWSTHNGTGVKDTVEVCSKDATDTYAWRTLY